jgi:hypothetical protein
LPNQLNFQLRQLVKISSLFQIRQQSEEKDQLEQVTFFDQFFNRFFVAVLLNLKVQISGFQKNELGKIQLSRADM